MEQEHLQIDFGNHQDMRAKLPEARRIRDKQRSQLSQLAAEVDWWETLVDMLERRLPPELTVSEPEARRELLEETVAVPIMGTDSLVDVVVGVVDREVRPIRAVEVARTLRDEGINVTNDAVANSLYYAAIRTQPARVQKLSRRGTYAPLAYVERVQRAESAFAFVQGMNRADDD